MRKRIYRATSTVLVVTTLFGQYSSFSYAKNQNEESTEEEKDNNQDSDNNAYSENTDIMSIGNESDATMVSEIIEARSEFSKQFLMSDNTKSVVMYTEPVHYENEDGTFVEIDNSLEIVFLTDR